MSIVEDSVNSILSLDGLNGSSQSKHRQPTQLEFKPLPVSSVATARLQGFDLDEAALVVGIPALPEEIIPARSTVTLLRSHVGSTVVLLFEQGDIRRPIIVGVLQEPRAVTGAVINPEKLVSVQTDDQRLVLTAEREIVLRCGEASITLTRAGKVLIKGKYVLNRSSGNIKIKGAAVDIN